MKRKTFHITMWAIILFLIIVKQSENRQRVVPLVEKSNLVVEEQAYDIQGYNVFEMVGENGNSMLIYWKDSDAKAK